MTLGKAQLKKLQNDFLRLNYLDDVNSLGADCLTLHNFLKLIKLM